MFNDSGKKIKKLAKTACYIGIGSACIVGLVILLLGMSLGMNGVAVIGVLLYIAIASFLAWLGSIVLYGFGELVDEAHLIRVGIEAINRKMVVSQKNSNESQEMKAPQEKMYENKAESVKKNATPSAIITEIDGETQKITTELEKQPIKKTESKVEVKQIFCSACKENLTFMGFSSEELEHGVKCPFCGKEVL